jgi:hypothetical protein
MIDIPKVTVSLYRDHSRRPSVGDDHEVHYILARLREAINFKAAERMYDTRQQVGDFTTTYTMTAYVLTDSEMLDLVNYIEDCLRTGRPVLF